MSTSPDDARVILDLTRHLTTNRSLAELLPVALRSLVAIVGAERALFALIDESGAVEDAVTHHLEWRPGTPLPISNSLVADVVRDGELHQITSADLASLTDLRVSVRKLALRFAVAVPVVVRDQVVGVLYADTTTNVKDPRGGRADLLRALAGIVGIAIENARLASEQHLRTMLVAKLVHDLRSPLMALELATSWLAQVLPPGSEDALSDLDGAAQSLQASCRSALRLAQLDGGTPEAPPQWTDLLSLTRAQQRLYLPVAEQYQVSIIVGDEGVPAVFTWFDRVRLVLENLLFNAIKHADRGGTVTVRLRLRSDPGDASTTTGPSAIGRLFRNLACLTPAPDTAFVEVCVHNLGNRIPADLLPNVFDEWVKGEDSGRGPASSGLGLAIVRGCVRSLGGRTWASSDAKDGTRFFFTVPVTAELRGPVDPRPWSGILGRV